MSVGIYLHFGLDRLLSFPRPRRHGTDRNPGIAFASLGSTERQYWDSLGDDFGAVFDVTGSDRGGVLRRAIGRYGKGARVAADYGCGVGRTLPLLAPRFRRVHALELAPRLLELARGRCAPFENVVFHRADLSRSAAGVGGVELGVCVNVLLSPDRGRRRAVLRTIRRSLAKRSHLVVVVPSLESALFTNGRLIEWNRRAGLRGAALLRESLTPSGRAARDLFVESVLDAGGAPTRHYLREDAIVTLQDGGFEVAAAHKVEYDWDSQFHRPPRWMGAPLPWDWLLVARPA